jgi:anti-anti-sigma factor
LLRTSALPLSEGISHVRLHRSRPDHSHGLVLAGELDIATAPALDAALLGTSGDVLVDCADLRFIDSVGFCCLDRGYDSAAARHSTFEVSGFSDFQKRVARMLGVPYVPSIAKLPDNSR